MDVVMELGTVVKFDPSEKVLAGTLRTEFGEEVPFTMLQGMSLEFSAPSHIPIPGEIIRFQRIWHDLESQEIHQWIFEDEWQRRDSDDPESDVPSLEAPDPAWRAEILDTMRGKAAGMSREQLDDWYEEVLDECFTEVQGESYINPAGVTALEARVIITQAWKAKR